jgi:hypothetical protein
MKKGCEMKSKYVSEDAMLVNTKMMYNDLAIMRDRMRRMWAAANTERELAFVEYLEAALENLSDELQIYLTE